MIQSFLIKVVKLLLSITWVRDWVAYQVIKWMSLQEFYQPVTNMAHLLQNWLDELDSISLLELKRLTLIALMHWFDICRYFGLRFTTHFSISLGRIYGVNLFFLFTLYNALSDNNPIYHVREYAEQIGGFPPSQIDAMRYFMNYLKDERRIRIELSTRQSVYKFGEPVIVTLTIQNLTNTPIILMGKPNSTINFKAMSMLKGDTDLTFKFLAQDGETNDQLILPIMKPVIINWKLNLPKKARYTIKSKIYIPHYQNAVTLLINVDYGTPPQDPTNINFCTL